MKHTNFLKILICCLVLATTICLAAFGVSSYTININGENISVSSLDSLSATGSGGISSLGGLTDVAALTASGIETISPSQDSNVSSAAPAMTTEKPERVEGGGGGLVSEDGSVAVNSDIVKVGLRYYYSKSRDNTLQEARLENSVGSGYEFGYYDADRNFVTVSSTDCTKLTMRITSGTGIGVYSTDSGQLLYEVSSTSRSSFLGIRPISEEEESLTWFKGYRYYGGFEYGVLGGNGITVINVVPLELYIQGVTAAEMSRTWHVEALKAQAVCARTYAATKILKSTYYYSSGFDLTGDTYSQAYNGVNQVDENIVAAVEATAGQCMIYNDSLVEALFMSSDGGSTEDCINVYGTSYPYLAGVYDPYEAYAPVTNSRASWTVTKTKAQMATISGLSDVVSVIPTYSDTGNVIAIEFTSSSGNTSVIQKDACRTKLGVNSIHYTIVANADGTYTLDGGGWGHNVGMSQFGAYAMASEFGASYKDILGYYYTGVSLAQAAYPSEE